jgi:hypothetical protein
MNNFRIQSLAFADDFLNVAFTNGQNLSVPVVFFPRLQAGTASERAGWELIGRGLGVHWEGLDEDLSVENILTAYSRHRGPVYSRAGGAGAS